MDCWLTTQHAAEVGGLLHNNSARSNAGRRCPLPPHLALPRACLLAFLPVVRNNTILLPCQWPTKCISDDRPTPRSFVSSYTVLNLFHWRHSGEHYHKFGQTTYRISGFTTGGLLSWIWFLVITWCNVNTRPLLQHAFHFLFTNCPIIRNYITWVNDCVAKKDINMFKNQRIRLGDWRKHLFMHLWVTTLCSLTGTC